MSSRWRLALGRLALATVPVLLFLLLIEALVRVSGAAETCPNRFSRGGGLWTCDPVLYFKLDPELRPNDQPLNERGFRGESFGEERPGMLRVLTLGDSCTFGYIGREEGVGYVFQPYPLKLQRFVERRIGEGIAEVFNAGVPGYNSHHGLLLLRSTLRDLRPDLITVRYGWNDHFLSGAGEADLYREPDSALGLRIENLLLRTKTYAFMRRLGLELRAATQPVKEQARDAFFEQKEYVPTVPLERYERNLRRIVQLGRESEAEVWLLTAPRNLDPSEEARRTLAGRNRLDFDRLMEIHDEYNMVVRRVGAELGVPVIDVAAAFASYRGSPVFLPSDVVHPAQGGQVLEAELLYAALLRQGLLREPKP